MKPEINVGTMEDVKMLLEAFIPHYKELIKAFELLDSIGIAASSDARKIARDDIERAALIVLSLLDLYRELHKTQCKHPGGCDIERGEAIMEEIESSLMETLRTIRQERELVANGLGGQSRTPQEIADRLLQHLGEVPPNTVPQASINPATGFYL